MSLGNLDIWSTPKLAPLYPRFPIQYRNVQILTSVYETSPEAIADHIGSPLTSINNYVMIHNYFMPDVEGMGVVEETNVMVGVSVKNLQGEEFRGGFSTNLLISSEVGLAQGREIHGQPKKLGSTKLEVNSDSIVGKVFRGESLVAQINSSYKSEESSIEQLIAYFPFAQNINHKVIRNIDGGQGINQITARTLSDVHVKGIWSGECTVELYPNTEAPVHLLPVVRNIRSFYWEADFALVPGVIVRDFIKEQSND
jgi:acetoacetate decarboxylase